MIWPSACSKGWFPSESLKNGFRTEEISNTFRPKLQKQGSGRKKKNVYSKKEQSESSRRFSLNANNLTAVHSEGF